MDRLQRSSFLQHLSGQVFLTHFQAIQGLKPEAAAVTTEPASSPI